MNDTVIRSRIDAKVKHQAIKLFEKMGLTLSEAIRLFIHQSVAEKGIPFTIKTPNAVTKAALEETKSRGHMQKTSLKQLSQDWDECVK